MGWTWGTSSWRWGGRYGIRNSQRVEQEGANDWTIKKLCGSGLCCWDDSHQEYASGFLMLRLEIGSKSTKFKDIDLGRSKH